MCRVRGMACVTCVPQSVAHPLSSVLPIHTHHATTYTTKYTYTYTCTYTYTYTHSLTHSLTHLHTTVVHAVVLPAGIVLTQTCTRGSAGVCVCVCVCVLWWW